MRERFARWSPIASAALLFVLGGVAGAAEAPGALGADSNAAGAAEAPGALGAGGDATGSYRVTLITGDEVRLRLFPDGRQAATVDPAPRGEGLPEPSFQTLEVNGDIYVIPSDAAPYLDDKLDRELFNLTELVAQGYHDEATRSLPLIVDFKRTVGALPPALVKVDTLESIEAAAAREPRGRATTFGRAVAAQARRDARAERPGAHATKDLFAGIEKIWLDAKVEATLEESVPQIGAPAAWSLGYDGSGVTAAVLDTGVDATHPDLEGKVAAARNFTTSPTETDRHGHGTHVASTIAGSGAASGGLRKGVAPGATIVSGKVLGDSGFGATSWIIAGMEWAAREQGADVVNMSLGGGPSDGSDPLSQAVDALTAETGALFAIAAGNFGPSDQTVTSPGAAASALTVGAVDKKDALAFFSSRGPRLGDFTIKPDLTAPGVGIAAARAAGTSLGTPVDDFYTRASGTSMATPHAAGAAALLAQRYPGWDADELKASLVTTASPGGPHTVYEQGGGRVDVARAFTQPTVLAVPAPLDLGFFPWPHEKRDPVTKTVAYTNLSDAELTLSLTLDVAGEDGNPPAPGMLSVDPATLTLGPGATKNVAVTLDTTGGDTGLYGGYLMAEDGSAKAVLRIPVGFYKESERYELTIVGIDREGLPAHRGFVDVMNVDNRDEFAEFLNFSGQLTVRVPPGHYSVMGFVRSWDDAQLFPTDASLLGDPEVTVTGDTEVVLDAREAKPVTVDVEDFDTRRLGYKFGYLRTDRAGRPFGHHFGSNVARPTFAGPTRPPSAGAFEYYSNWRLVGPDPVSTPYLFDLVFPEKGSIPASLHYVVDAQTRERELATVTNRYYTHQPDTHRWTRHHWRPWQSLSAEFVRDLRVPLIRTEYLSAGDNRWQQTVFFRYPRPSMLEPLVTYLPGEKRQQTWFKQPARPGVLEGTDLHPGRPAYRTGDTLTLMLPEWVDAQEGHWGWKAATDTTAFRLFRDGELIAESDRPRGDFKPLPPASATYRLEFDAARAAPWWTLSTETRTAWTFRSARPPAGSQEILPLLLVDYDLNLDLLNRAPLPQESRGPNVLNFTVRHQRGAAGQPVEGLRLWVSYDDGTSWKQKQVQSRGGGRFQAVLDQRDIEETVGFVSLRVAAWDRGGSRIEQEIIRAYGLKTREAE